ncbi:MAG: type II toxin-antitoxin system HipA family toxin [Vicinamibacterales bacterium]
MTTQAPERASASSRVQTLEVRLGETVVGALTHLGNEALIFTFDPAYVEAVDRPALSLCFKAADGSLVEQTRPTRARLTPFFSNLLPEAHLREYLAARGGVHPDREFYLIWLLGADLPGAIEVRSMDGTPPPRGPDDGQRESREDRPLHFSLAGVQLKFSALMETSKGLALPVDGVGGDWIVKLPSPRFEAVPENEYAMMTLARAAGIDVPEVRLVSTSDVVGLPRDLPEAFGVSLAVRRFDRPAGGGRVHIEDFAQVFGVYPEHKYRRASYGSIARVLWLEAGEEAITEYTRRLAFNALIGNADAHLKNWSLVYPDRRTAKLAPAYDLVATVPYIPGDRLALSLGDTKAFAETDLARFRRLAERAGLPDRLVVQAARETAAKVRDLWPAHEPLRALPERIRGTIERHMATVPL